MGQAARLPLPETETQMTGRLAARPTKLRVPHGIAGRRARQCFIDVQRAKTLAGKPPAPPEKPSRRCPTGAELESPGKSVQIHPPKPQPGRSNPARDGVCRRIGVRAARFAHSGNAVQDFDRVFLGWVPLATALGRQCDCRSVFRRQTQLVHDGGDATGLRATLLDRGIPRRRHWPRPKPSPDSYEREVLLLLSIAS